jgi:hypothetical protein
MLKSFRFWCFAAAAVSLLTTVLHVFGGGPEFLQPAIESPLSFQWKAAFSTVWHEITALLFLNGVFLIAAGLSLRKNKLALWLVLLLNVAFALLFFGYGIAWLGAPWLLLQWVIFVAISGLTALALRMPEKLHLVEETTAKSEHYSVLPNATFADRYVAHGTQFTTAIDAARGAFGKAPRWISKLMQLRNALVAPFGLVHEAPKSSANAIGMFPILDATKQKVILGLDDKHLDFRVVVELLNAGQSVSLTTLVEPHHFLGKAYLAVIMPFHRIIAATILTQAAKNNLA